jgi:uncharacterized protein
VQMAPFITEMRNGVRRCLLALALVFFAALPALAIDFPPLTGRVVDLADLLSPDEEAALSAKLQAFEQKSSDQIVVATIPSLNGEVLEDYANKLYRTWQLGQKQENNGVLLLVARDDHKLRIEVGYGLEGQLTDVMSKLIIENSIVPAFRAGDYAGGIAKGADDIITVVSGDGAELEARAKRNLQVDSGNAPDTVFLVIFGIFFTLIFGSIVFSMLAHVFGTKIGPRHYLWLGINVYDSPPSSGGSSGGGWSSGGGGWSSGGGGFSGGGGSSGGGGASGGW